MFSFNSIHTDEDILVAYFYRTSGMHRDIVLGLIRAMDDETRANTLELARGTIL